MTPWTWGDWKVVSLDIETTKDKDADVPPDDPTRFHVLDIGTVTMRHGRVMSRWGELVNPGVPIDAVSYAVHGHTDKDVEHAPAFADVEPTLTRVLTPDTDDQPVIVIAHKTSFDLPILRAAYQRIGLDVPDVAIIDTLDDLPALTGVDKRRQGRSLEKTAKALGVPTHDLHTGSGDAEVTARMFLRMLDLAAEKGYYDFPSLLADLPAERSLDIEPDLPGDEGRFVDDLTVPDEHIATHNHQFFPDGDNHQLWVDGAKECVELRCPNLQARRQAASNAPTPLDRENALGVIDELLTHAQDLDAGLRGPAVATVLGAFANDLSNLWSKKDSGRSPIAAVKRWHTKWSPTLSQLDACTTLRCPDCRAGRPCPIEMWAEWLATRLFSVAKYQPKGTKGQPGYNPKGDKTSDLYTNVVRSSSGRSVNMTYLSLRDPGLIDVADHHVGLCIERLTSDGHIDRAHIMAEEAWSYHGGRGHGSHAPTPSCCTEPTTEPTPLPSAKRRLLATSAHPDQPGDCSLGPSGCCWSNRHASTNAPAQTHPPQLPAGDDPADKHAGSTHEPPAPCTNESFCDNRGEDARNFTNQPASNHAHGGPRWHALTTSSTASTTKNTQLASEPKSTRFAATASSASSSKATNPKRSPPGQPFELVTKPCFARSPTTTPSTWSPPSTATSPPSNPRKANNARCPSTTCWQSFRSKSPSSRD